MPIVRPSDLKLVASEKSASKSGRISDHSPQLTAMPNWLTLFTNLDKKVKKTAAKNMLTTLRCAVLHSPGFIA